MARRLARKSNREEVFDSARAEWGILLGIGFVLVGWVVGFSLLANPTDRHVPTSPAAVGVVVLAPLTLVLLVGLLRLLGWPQGRRRDRTRMGATGRTRTPREGEIDSPAGGWWIPAPICAVVATVFGWVASVPVARAFTREAHPFDSAAMLVSAVALVAPPVLVILTGWLLWSRSRSGGR